MRRLPRYRGSAPGQEALSRRPRVGAFAAVPAFGQVAVTLNGPPVRIPVDRDHRFRRIVITDSGDRDHAGTGCRSGDIMPHQKGAPRSKGEDRTCVSER